MNQVTPGISTEEAGIEQMPVNETTQSKEYRKMQKNRPMAVMNTNLRYYNKDEFECGVFLSQLPEVIMNEMQSRAREEKTAVPQKNSALKQLMSSDIQSTLKQKKIILFVGQDSHSGQTIQNKSYNDRWDTCAEIEVNSEIVIDGSSPKLLSKKKEKYQYDTCNQSFDQIASDRQHKVGSHTNSKLPAPQNKGNCVVCSYCGKIFKSQGTYEKHRIHHGDPDFECVKCWKVYASKSSLRVHMKIHDRKHSCMQCMESYEKFQELRDHVKQNHTLYMCHNQNCAFVGTSPTDLIDHQHCKKTKVTKPEQEKVDGKFGSRSNQEASGDFSKPNRELERSVNLAKPKRDLSRSSREFVWPSEDLTKSMDIEEKQKNEADSEIAKVKFVKAKRHTSRKTCEVCVQYFSRLNDLKRHLIQHVIKSIKAKLPSNGTGSLKITCEVCQIKTFNKIEKYHEHLSEHAQLTIYKCTICDKFFNNSSNFSRHSKLHGIAGLQCEICRRRFYSKQMLTQHKEQYNRMAPAQCTYCNKMFHFESGLKKHVRRAHRMKDASVPL